jgi:hypothetical protein
MLCSLRVTAATSDRCRIAGPGLVASPLDRWPPHRSFAPRPYPICSSCCSPSAAATTSSPSSRPSTCASTASSTAPAMPSAPSTSASSRASKPRSAARCSIRSTSTWARLRSSVGAPRACPPASPCPPAAPPPAPCSPRHYARSPTSSCTQSVYSRTSTVFRSSRRVSQRCSAARDRTCHSPSPSTQAIPVSLPSHGSSTTGPTSRAATTRSALTSCTGWVRPTGESHCSRSCGRMAFVMATPPPSKLRSPTPLVRRCLPPKTVGATSPSTKQSSPISATALTRLRSPPPACCTDPSAEQGAPPWLTLGSRCFTLSAPTELQVELISGDGQLVLRSDYCDRARVVLGPGESEAITASACRWKVVFAGPEHCDEPTEYRYAVTPL